MKEISAAQYKSAGNDAASSIAVMRLLGLNNAYCQLQTQHSDDRELVGTHRVTAF